MDRPETPLDLLHAMAVQEVTVVDALRHLEVFTLEGLLTLLWHGDPGFGDVVLACGGAIGGVLGPADALYHDLGVHLAERGIGMIRVGYRRPGELASCVDDLLAAADLAARHGACRFVTMGHSFGGAVAVRAATGLGDAAAGVVTLATQSAGCEIAARLGDTPLLLFHGDADELLPPETSLVVQSLAGGRGELVVLPGTGHLMVEAAGELRARLARWIPERFGAAGA